MRVRRTLGSVETLTGYTDVALKQRKSEQSNREKRTKQNETSTRRRPSLRRPRLPLPLPGLRLRPFLLLLLRLLLSSLPLAEEEGSPLDGWGSFEDGMSEGDEVFEEGESL